MSLRSGDAEVGRLIVSALASRRDHREHYQCREAECSPDLIA